MKFYIVDCFAEEKYQGNELLVVIADRAISDHEQQQIAREINFSETALILSSRRDNGGYDIRIWTPNVGEVPFAGHPTLGTAFVIHRCIEHGQGNLVRLNLKVGQIPVAVTSQGLTMSQKDIEPTYREITNGTWLDDSPYGVVHRIAGDGSEKGIGAFCINWAYEQCGHLRIDTHGDNTVMQNLVKKLGFVHCGTIYVEEDDYPRLAFEKISKIEV